MSDTKTDKIEKMEGALDQPKLPEVNADGIKIYPTSFIPAKAHMDVSRIPTAKLTGLEIEISHVIIFVGLIFFLFIGMWKRPNSR